VIPVAIHEPSLPEGLVAIPVRTRLIASGDDLRALLEAALAGLARPRSSPACSPGAPARSRRSTSRSRCSW
jgi:hypothetical protein